jgi:hypothetical protein
MVLRYAHLDGRQVQPGTQASIPERSGRVVSSQVGGVHILQVNLAVPDELCASVVPWFKQILKVFVCGLTQYNGHTSVTCVRCRYR